jgi:hypothetical protein
MKNLLVLCLLIVACDDGMDGSIGIQGEMGTAGSNGDDGINGDDGDDGEVGQNGQGGVPGATGTPGNQGEQGRDGEDGADGDDGQGGSMGPQGEPGLNGLDGFDGDAGPQGEQGEPGPGVRIVYSGFLDHAVGINRAVLHIDLDTDNMPVIQGWTWSVNPNGVFKEWWSLGVMAVLPNGDLVISQGNAKGHPYRVVVIY